MKASTSIWLGMAASLGLATAARAQLPAPPGGAAAGAGAAGVAPASAASASASGGSSNLWSFLFPNAQQKQNLKNCLCNSPIGQMMAGAAGPMGAMSGGLIQNRCAQNQIANDLLKSGDSPDGLAAQIKKDEADAKARRAAVRYLGTVDCNYWPEAIDVLKKSLRGDRNECVRFEAALALQSGCCCKEEIIAALTNCVAGPAAEEDGFPKEFSPRVRAAAADALAHCVMVPLPPPAADLAPPPRPLEKTQVPLKPEATYTSTADPAHQELIAKAREVLQSRNGRPVAATSVATAQRPSSLADVLGNAFSPRTAGSATVPTQSAAGTPALQTREPFFANVTRALKGRQDVAISVHRPAFRQSASPAPTPSQPIAARPPRSNARALLTFDDTPSSVK